ncbi:MAG: SufE family protein [Gammaproteobacteria bacterium]|nr:SufE family protein [Gammaproteobacteria bacterium]
MSSEIERAQQELIEEFAFFDDWMARYQYIIDMGRELPEFPDEWRTEDNRVHGCQSQVWLHADARDGRLHFQATSDSAIVAGLIALLMRIYSGRRAAEIVATEPGFVTELGLDRHLSATRSNGLRAMLQRIRAQAAEMTQHDDASA